MAFNQSMHPRNPFKTRPPDFKQLARKYPEFRQHCTIVAGGKVCFDFTSADAVRLLSMVLLLEYFGLDVDLPKGSLVPRIPQRMNYLLLLEDLLQLNGLIRVGGSVAGIDIGVGCSCVYPLLGARLNGWNFYGSDVGASTIQKAMENVKRNSFEDRIRLVQSHALGDVFKSIMDAAGSGAEFAFCMCNPPFFDPDECAEKFPVRQENGAGVMNECRKRRAENAPRSTTQAHPNEVSVSGGEVDFIRWIVQESIVFQGRKRIFTTMIGRKASWQPVSKMLEDLGSQVKHRQLYSLSQGRTQRWVVAWTFDPSISLPK